MATTYHIRTFTSKLESGLSTPQYSNDNILQVYNEASLPEAARPYGMKTRPDTVFNTTAQEFFHYALYDDPSDYRQSPPQYATMDADDIRKISTTDGYMWWSNYSDTWDDSRWDSYGWTNPTSGTYTTWLDEICTKFNTYRAGSEHSHDDNWNVYVFKYTTDDSTYYYFPLFTKGNDPYYDSQVVI